HGFKAHAPLHPMSFATIEHNGREIALLLIVPNVRDDGALNVAYSFTTDVDAGRTDRESRWPVHEAPRLVQRCTYTLRATEAAQLRYGLADLGTKLVGVPLWADRLSGAGWASAIHAPQYLVN